MLPRSLLLDPDLDDADQSLLLSFKFSVFVGNFLIFSNGGLPSFFIPPLSFFGENKETFHLRLSFPP